MTQESAPRMVPCPICETTIDRDSMTECPRCHMDATDPAVDDFIAAEAAIAQCKEQYELARERWQQWYDHRKALKSYLDSTRFRVVEPAASDPTPIPAPSGPAPTADAGPTSPQEVSEATDGPGQDQVAAHAAPAGATAADSVPSPIAEPVLAGEPTPPGAPVSAGDSAGVAAQAGPDGPRAPQARPPAERRAPRLLTAPVLLGVSGASLLIAAAIVFVAVTWNTFLPLAQGLLILAISVGVAYLARWLKRLTLVITAGAVGVAAMAFAGVSVIAFDREALVLGAFATPTALAVTAAAGLALERWRLRWVNASSALAVVGVAVGVTWAWHADFSTPGSVVWAVVGTGTAALVAVGLRWWRGVIARVILRGGAVGWATLSALIAAVGLYRAETQAVEVAVLAVPVAALVAGVWWAPRLVAGPAGFVAVIAAASATSHATGDAWVHLTVAVAVAAVLVAVAARMPERAREPLTVGVMPALAGAALAALAAGVWWLIAMVRLLAEGAQTSLMTNLSAWAGLAAVLGAAGLMAIRLWPEPARVAGYAHVSVALWAPGVASSTYLVVAHTVATVPAVVIAGIVGAGLLVLAAPLWPVVVPRRVSRVSGLVLAIIAAVLGTRDVWSSGADGWSITASVLALAALAACARWWLRTAVLAATLVAPVVAAGIAQALGAPTEILWMVAAGVLVVLGAVGRAIPERGRNALVWGSSPTVAVLIITAMATLVIAVGVLASHLSGAALGADTYPVTSVDWGLAVAAALTGVALSLPRLWRPVPQWLTVPATTGAALMVVGLTAVSLDVAQPWVAANPLTLTMALGAAAIAATALSPVAGPRAAVWTLRGSAIALMTLAGAHGALVLSAAHHPWWIGAIAAGAPTLLLATASRWWLPQSLPSTAFLATLIVAATVVHAGGPDLAAGAAAVFLATALLWGALRAPHGWVLPLLGGLVPALAWGVGVALWTAVGLLARIASAGGGTPLVDIDPWAVATTMTVGVAFAAMARLPVGAAAARANSMVGALVMVLGSAALTGAVADAWALPATTSFALASLVAAASAAAVVALWTTSNARWVNGVGATVLVTIAGLNGAAVLADADQAWWVGAALVVGPVAILAACGRWWPRLTLAPATFTATVAAAVLASRLELSDEAVVVFAVVMAAIIAWIATLVAPVRQWSLMAGTAPAVLTACLVALWVLPWSLATVVGADLGLGEFAAHLWAAGAMAALAGAMAASRRWSVGAAVVNAAGVVGALAVLGAAMSLTAAATVSADRWWAWDTLVGLGSGLLVAASIGAWVTRRARWVAGIAATSWVTVVALVAVANLTLENIDWWAGLGVVTLACAMLVVAARWQPRVTLGPAAVVASMGATGAVAGEGGDWDQIHFAAAASLAVLLWVAHTLSRLRAVPLRWGAVPAAVITGVVLLMLVPEALARYLDTLLGHAADPLGPWAGGTALMALAAALTWSQARRHAGWVAVPFLALASASLPALVAAVTLAVLAGAVAVRPARVRSTPESALVLALLALGWAAPEHAPLSVGAAVITAIALWTAISDISRRDTWTLVLAPVAGASAMWWLVSAVGGTPDISATVAAGAALSMPVLARAWGIEPRLPRALVMVSIATAVMPFLASSLTVAGIISLMAAAAWLALAVVGLRAARWVSITALSAGSALLLIDANVQVIEAYTAVPAAGVLGVGLWWLYNSPQVHSMRALGPGLALALVPSYLALVLQPGSLTRTLILTAATVALALTGVLLKWFAPVLATAVTAVVVSVAQIVVGDNIAVRVVSFAVVGALLLVIATTYEKLKELR